MFGGRCACIVGEEILNTVFEFEKRQVSVVQSVHEKDDPTHLCQSIKSVVSQTLMPSKYIIVRDGPLTRELDAVILSYEQQYPELFLFLRNPISLGLGASMNIALATVDTPFIARMDSDDICYKDRFNMQVNYLISMPNVDVVGCQVIEIDHDGLNEQEIYYPTEHGEMLRFFEKRSPIAHPSAMFRSRYFEKIGRGYREVPKFDQDRELWFQGFMNACVFGNLEQTHLRLRRNKNFFQRRNSFFVDWKRFVDKCNWNRKLGFGFRAHLFAFLYFIMSRLPVSLKRLLYGRRNLFR